MVLIFPPSHTLANTKAITMVIIFDDTTPHHFTGVNSWRFTLPISPHAAVSSPTYLTVTTISIYICLKPFPPLNFEAHPSGEIR